MRPMLANVAARIRGSVWTGPLLKLALVLVGLFVLAGIGHTVTATAAVGGQVPPAAAAASASSLPTVLDAGPRDAASDAAGEAEASAPVVHSPRATPDDPVFLNEATATDLRRLPGIGEKRAQAILELRAKLGRFRQVEELLRVKGIGRATLKKLRPLVRIDHPDGG